MLFHTMPPVKRPLRLNRYTETIGLRVSTDMYASICDHRDANENLGETVRRLIQLAIDVEGGWQTPGAMPVKSRAKNKKVLHDNG